MNFVIVVRKFVMCLVKREISSGQIRKLIKQNFVKKEIEIDREMTLLIL